jgi:hypothetical protein
MGHFWPLTSRFWMLWVLLSVAPPSVGQETCLKLVFGRYCLGGDVGALAARQPMVRQNDGERVALVFPEGPERVYVLSFRNQIYKVVRRYRTATQLKFDDLYALLRSKYGDGEDRSRFPPSATAPGRRLISIRRGEGRAFHYWKPADDWHIELTWTRELGLALAYVATSIDGQQQTAVERGL